MNHKRRRPKYQRAGCNCMGKEGKNAGHMRLRDAKRLPPEMVGKIHQSGVRT